MPRTFSFALYPSTRFKCTRMHERTHVFVEASVREVHTRQPRVERHYTIFGKFRSQDFNTIDIALKLLTQHFGNQM